MRESLLALLTERRANVAVIGQGYVGLVLAMRASEAGFPVVGLEVDEGRARNLEAGLSYVEDVTDDVLRAALVRGYRPSTDPDSLKSFDVAVITVPTPLSEGVPDLSHIESATRMIGERLQPGTLVVLESTTYPGTTEELVAPLLESSSGLRCGADFFLGYSPERIDPGNQTFSLHNTPKVISGIDVASLSAVAAFYGTFVDQLVPVANPAEAELVKLIENTFRHVNVALMNELAVFAHGLGVDIWSALEATATKPYGYLPFKPGPGVGGHCLPVDPSYLSWRVKRRTGETFRFVELANEVNAHMPGYVVQRVVSALNREQLALNGSTVLVLGLAYKARSSDARESPSLPIIEQLGELGALVLACDPHVRQLTFGATVERVDLSAEVLRRSDLVLLLTDHPEFDYDLIAREARRVLDTRNCFPAGAGPHIEKL